MEAISTASSFDKLMNKLGYGHYLAQGGDWCVKNSRSLNVIQRLIVPEQGCTSVSCIRRVSSRYMPRNPFKHDVFWSPAILQEPLDIGKGYARLCRVAWGNIHRRSKGTERGSKIYDERHWLFQGSRHTAPGMTLQTTLHTSRVGLFTPTPDTCSCVDW
jgi:hypothetical protein